MSKSCPFFSPSISGNQNNEHCGKPESDPDTKGEILPTEANAELINLKSNGHLLFLCLHLPLSLSLCILYPNY